MCILLMILIKVDGLTLIPIFFNYLEVFDASAELRELRYLSNNWDSSYLVGRIGTVYDGEFLFSLTSSPQGKDGKVSQIHLHG